MMASSTLTYLLSWGILRFLSTFSNAMLICLFFFTRTILIVLFALDSCDDLVCHLRTGCFTITFSTHRIVSCGKIQITILIDAANISRINVVHMLFYQIITCYFMVGVGCVILKVQFCL